MSDSGAETEAALLRGERDALRADVLVLGRHGDDFFATAEFLAAVKPRAIILAAPDPFREGSDEPALRERLAATGAEVFDQSTCGAVTIRFGHRNAELRSFLGEQSAEFHAR